MCGAHFDGSDEMSFSPSFDLIHMQKITLGSIVIIEVYEGYKINWLTVYESDGKVAFFDLLFVFTPNFSTFKLGRR